MQQVILYSLHTAPATFLAALGKAIAQTTNPVHKFRLQMLNVSDWTQTLQTAVGLPVLLPEVFNLASVLYRVKQDRSPGLLQLMLTVLSKLSPAPPLAIRKELLSLPLASLTDLQKPLIDLSAAEAEFFCDLCSGLESGRSAAGSIQELLISLVSDRFQDLSRTVKLKLMLVAEQCRLKEIPVEHILMLAGELSKCQLARVVYEALDYELLASIYSPFMTEGEKYLKLLPLRFKSDSHLSHSTQILPFTRLTPHYLPTSALKSKAEKLISDFNFLSDMKQKAAKRVSLTLSRLLILVFYGLEKYQERAFFDVFAVLYEGLRDRFDVYLVKSAAVRMRAFQALRLMAECERDFPAALKAELLSEQSLFPAFSHYFHQAKTQKDQCLLLSVALAYARKSHCLEAFSALLQGQFPQAYALLQAIQLRE